MELRGGEGLEEGKKAKASLASASTAVSPVSTDLQGRVLAVKSVSLRSSVCKRMLTINIFMPPVLSFLEEVVLSRIEMVALGIDPRDAPLLNALSGHVHKVKLSRGSEHMSFFSEKKMASLKLQLSLTGHGERNLGTVLATVEEYMKQAKAFLEENYEQFKGNVLFFAPRLLKKRIRQLLAGPAILDTFEGIAMGGNGLGDTEQLLNSAEQWERGGYSGLPEYPGLERLDGYIRAALDRITRREFWAVSRISAEGPFPRKVPYFLNGEARAEKWPEIQEEAREEIGRKVRECFSWNVSRREEGSWSIGYSGAAREDVLSTRLQERFISALEKYSGEVTVESVEKELENSSPALALPELEMQKQAQRLTVTTTYAPLHQMQFAWSSPSPGPEPLPRQSCTLFFYTAAMQPDPSSAAAVILHLCVVLNQLIDRYYKIVRDHVDIAYEADADGNVSITIKAQGSSDVDYVGGMLQQFLNMYRAGEPCSEEELDLARSMAVCAILEQCEKKEGYVFSPRRFTTALTTHLDVREVLERMDTLSPSEIGETLCKALEVQFEQFASFERSFEVYRAVLDTFGVGKTEEFTREEKRVNRVWHKLWSAEGRKRIKVRRTTSEVKRNHVFFAVPVPLSAKKMIVRVLADFCLRMGDYFAMDFMRTRLPVYYCYLYLYKVPVPPAGPQRYLLCCEVSGMAPAEDIVAAIQGFLVAGVEYYVQHVFPLTLPRAASLPEGKEMQSHLSAMLGEAKTLVLTEVCAEE